MENNIGKLFLIPATIGDAPAEFFLPPAVIEITDKLRDFIVEDQRTARRYLRSIGFKHDFDQVRFHELNKHQPEEGLDSFLNAIHQGRDIGLLSEAGVPCVADPGGLVVALAQRKNIRVVPLVGPSSIILALMASGFNGQNFAFIGYLPVDKNERHKTIKRVENLCYQLNQTHIFIETPYRNQALFEDLLKVCKPGTRLCIASNITCQDELIKSMPVREWEKQALVLQKKPTIFLLYRD
ncbi:MAG: SAM-dependent methyltransferase [Bacteroidales bacterium]|nr:SAM-dependent methyltransferase [Bacteroidales bacterium]